MIRAALPSDAPAIGAIWNDVIRSSTITFTSLQKSEAEIQSRIASRPVLVAQAKGQVVGFATYGPFRDGPGYRHTAEHSVYVRPTEHGAGYGKALMAELEEIARRDGIRVLVAGIGGENAGAMAFHARLGYATAGRLRGVGTKFGRHLDLILMTKNL